MSTNGPNWWILTKIRRLSLDSPLARRFLRYQKPLPAPLAYGQAFDPEGVSFEKAVQIIDGADPDHAWLIYRRMPPAMQAHVAQHCSPKQWGQLLIREIQSKAQLELASQLERPANPASRRQHFEFRKRQVECAQCGWHGVGAECQAVEVHEHGGITDYGCPRCAERIGSARSPSLQEYYENWGSLTEAERQYVFVLEQRQFNSESKPAA